MGQAKAVRTETRTEGQEDHLSHLEGFQRVVEDLGKTYWTSQVRWKEENHWIREG